MQPSYEWECHHLRPAYIAVSVPVRGGGRTKHISRFCSEENMREGKLLANYCPLNILLLFVALR